MSQDRNNGSLVSEKSLHEVASLSQMVERYRSVRRLSEQIAQPLTPEDCAIQSMVDASPIRWHLAHTTWFFETFLLRNEPSYTVFDEAFETLFNSYYNTVGEPFPRNRRGQISRPGMQEVRSYRHHVDEALVAWIEQGRLSARDRDVLELGLNHEQQHQELMLTDIKHVFFSNPLHPAYHKHSTSTSRQTLASQSQPMKKVCDMHWHAFEEAIVQVGHGTPETFAYDNEMPSHRTLIQRHAIASRCVTNGEYLQFIEDGGYKRAEHWLSLGWSHVMADGWEAPLYWCRRDDAWFHFTLRGLVPLELDEPVCHISYFEADAFARWAGWRLPTEFEWEHAAVRQSRSESDHDDATPQGVFADKLFRDHQPIHPKIECASTGLDAANDRPGLFGNVWQWTSSHYSPYPGYRPTSGALGEYNGKFMCNQFVLRGGSCASSADHLRASYRNFFPPETRWQFSGIRLARD